MFPVRGATPPRPNTISLNQNQLSASNERPPCAIGRRVPADGLAKSAEDRGNHCPREDDEKAVVSACARAEQARWRWRKIRHRHGENQPQFESARRLRFPRWTPAGSRGLLASCSKTPRGKNALKSSLWEARAGASWAGGPLSLGWTAAAASCGRAGGSRWRPYWTAAEPWPKVCRSTTRVARCACQSPCCCGPGGALSESAPRPGGRHSRAPP